jgi:hypothetical protein
MIVMQRFTGAELSLYSCFDSSLGRPREGLDVLRHGEASVRPLEISTPPHSPSRSFPHSPGASFPRRRESSRSKLDPRPSAGSGQALREGDFPFVFHCLAEAQSYALRQPALLRIGALHD